MHEWTSLMQGGRQSGWD